MFNLISWMVDTQFSLYCSLTINIYLKDFSVSLVGFILIIFCEQSTAARTQGLKSRVKGEKTGSGVNSESKWEPR